MKPFLTGRVPLVWLYLSTLTAVVLGILLWLFAISAPPSRALLVERPAAQVAQSTPSLSARIDLNSATAAELESLPGIGPTLSARIVEYRAEHGPFRSLEDLANVSGVGEATLDRLRPYITIK